MIAGGEWLNEISAQDAHFEKKRSRRLWLVIGSIVLVVLIVLAFAAYLIITASPPRILSVSFSPENPSPGEKVTVTAHVEGGSFLSSLSVRLCFGTYLSDGGGGGGTMRPMGDNRYQLQIRSSFPDGAEVWFVVSAATDSEGPVLSENYTFQVGEVIRDGPSGLIIEHVAQSPEEPTSLDTVIVTARIVSASNITDVELVCMSFTRHGSGGGSGFMDLVSGDNYTAEIVSTRPGGISERGTVHLYRVAAMDETENTAVSEVYSFAIA